MVNPLNVGYINVYFIGGENVHIELIHKSIMLHSSTEKCNIILFTQGRISENGVFVGESLNSVVINTSKTACGKKIMNHYMQSINIIMLQPQDVKEYFNLMLVKS